MVTLEMPSEINARVIYLGSKSASISTGSSSDVDLDANGVCWNG